MIACHDDLHSRAQPQRPRRPEPGRSAVSGVKGATANAAEVAAYRGESLQRRECKTVAFRDMGQEEQKRGSGISRSVIWVIWFCRILVRRLVSMVNVR